MALCTAMYTGTWNAEWPIPLIGETNFCYFLQREFGKKAVTKRLFHAGNS